MFLDMLELQERIF